MLKNIENIREVLEEAHKLELPGSGTALKDLKEIHSAILNLKEAYDELQKELEEQSMELGRCANG